MDPSDPLTELGLVEQKSDSDKRSIPSTSFADPSHIHERRLTVVPLFFHENQIQGPERGYVRKAGADANIMSSLNENYFPALELPKPDIPDPPEESPPEDVFKLDNVKVVIILNRKNIKHLKVKLMDFASRFKSMLNKVKKHIDEIETFCEIQKSHFENEYETYISYMQLKIAHNFKQKELYESMIRNEDLDFLKQKRRAIVRQLTKIAETLDLIEVSEGKCLIDSLFVKGNPQTLMDYYDSIVPDKDPLLPVHLKQAIQDLNISKHECQEYESFSRMQRVQRIVSNVVEFFQNEQQKNHGVGYNKKKIKYKQFPASENKLARFLCDIRYSEGKELQKFITNIDKDNELIAEERDEERKSSLITKKSKKIVQFLIKYMKGFFEKYKIEEKIQKKMISLMVQRVVFKRFSAFRILPDTHASNWEEVLEDNNPRDSILLSQLSWLRKMSQKQIGFPEDFRMNCFFLQSQFDSPELISKLKESVCVNDEMLNPLAYSNQVTRIMNPVQFAQGFSKFKNYGNEEQKKSQPDSLSRADMSLLNADFISKPSPNRPTVPKSKPPKFPGGRKTDLGLEKFVERRKKLHRMGSKKITSWTSDVFLKSNIEQIAKKPSRIQDRSSFDELFEDESDPEVDQEEIIHFVPTLPENPVEIQRQQLLDQVRTVNKKSLFKHPQKRNTKKLANNGLSSFDIEFPFVASYKELETLRMKNNRQCYPFIEAIRTLEELNGLFAPVDMLNCLVACAQDIYRMARIYAILKDSVEQTVADKRKLNSKIKPRRSAIGADDFFPLFLWVLIHSNIPAILRILHVLKNFSSKAEKQAETGYYLSCLEGALDYIIDVKKSGFSSPEFCDYQL